MNEKMKHVLNICIFSSVFLFSCSIIAFTIVFTHHCSRADHNSDSRSHGGGKNREFLRQSRESVDTNDLDVWEPPLELQHSYPYYLSGFDDENRPIWIAELGKWNIRKIVEEGRGKLFEKYFDQLLYRFNKSISLRSTSEAPVIEGVAIVDMENYDLTQAASLPTLQLMLRKASDVAAVATKMEKSYFLNANFVAESFINLIRPILGSVLSRVQVYGTNKQRWIPKLLRDLPRESLPEWYGGVKHFLPIQVYG